METEKNDERKKKQEVLGSRLRMRMKTLGEREREKESSGGE
jgi:hypothetical protein